MYNIANVEVLRVLHGEPVKDVSVPRPERAQNNDVFLRGGDFYHLSLKSLRAAFVCGVVAVKYAGDGFVSPTPDFLLCHKALVFPENNWLLLFPLANPEWWPVVKTIAAIGIIPTREWLIVNVSNSVPDCRYLLHISAIFASHKDYLAFTKSRHYTVDGSDAGASLYWASVFA